MEKLVSRSLMLILIGMATAQNIQAGERMSMPTSAKELIKQRRGNVSDIAYLVGFKDAHYFSVCFKKEFNMTPGEYMETICS